MTLHNYYMTVYDHHVTAGQYTPALAASCQAQVIERWHQRKAGSGSANSEHLTTAGGPR